MTRIKESNDLNRVIQYRGQIFAYLDKTNQVYSYDPITSAWIERGIDLLPGDLEVRDGGLYIKDPEPDSQDCNCDLQTVIMRVGCQCGGK